MDNIRNVIKILFRGISPNEVLQRGLELENFLEHSFALMANYYMPHYSDNEIGNMFSFLRSEFEWHNNKMWGRETEGELQINEFDAILLFSDSVLVEENGVPLCRYEHLLRWREMTVILDEDLFVTAFLAQKDLLTLRARKDFFWPPVIGHNNKELNRLLAQGVAENHFHLKGSSPTFHLSWISMMNHVTNPIFMATFEQYEKRRLSRRVVYQTVYAEHTLYLSYLQAALIRLYLFACMKDDFFTLKGSCISTAKVLPYLRMDRLPTEVKLSEPIIDLDQLVGCLLPEDYKHFKVILMRKDVDELLRDPEELLFYLPDVQRSIETMREKYGAFRLDYTICEPFLMDNPNNHLNEVISGERWFLYEVFRRIYGSDSNFKGNINWFYAYILIKETIRSELIQANGNVGFHNFLLYQKRKESFIEGTPFEKVYLQMAIRDTIHNQHIKKLEARIVPKKSAKEIKKSIEKYDGWIVEREPDKEAFLKRFFYVCHFIKEPDDGLEQVEFLQGEYRHYHKRNEVKKQAWALYAFRERYGAAAQRVRGIDAASEEIGCRPEVFAQAFRFLKNQYVEYMDEKKGVTKKLPDLCVTYHVGEDFLDVTDGLRAIDEAIEYLNMRCGDRLGHALALGVNVKEWYASKAGRILISQMDYLDNLVWLYAKIRKYRIEGCEDTIRYIQKRYDEYFRIIYLNNMSDVSLRAVMNDAFQYYQKRKIQNHYEYKQYYFSINTYYDSWKLRGDNPEYFRDGYFRLDDCDRSEWDKHGINKIYPENYRIRYNPEAAYLFYTYHYNARVKREGNKKKEIKINPCIVKAVALVQKKMQWLIAQRGICIETNPSSNALIGTFKRYDKHPILNWYNKGLAMDAEELRSVPQIQVSINTDDQGVFATYIENEYAYLALALEKMKDENGNPKFSRTLIYQWLDNVRKMGLVQSFENVDG